MNYLEITIKVADLNFAEILEAELSELPFESFENRGNELYCYIQEKDLIQPDLQDIINAYQSQITSLDIRKVNHENWNAVWESNYDPVSLGKEVFIGAHFHERPVGFDYYITLEPNMSFGTGHHPTTSQVLEHMFNMTLENKNVLDFGCGSGVLAIYAAYRQAHGIGIEIDEHAAEAARQNLELNNVESFEIITGGLEMVQKRTFNHVLANINRNVIEESLKTFNDCLLPEGQLICSGFLVSDVEPLSKEIESHGFEILKTKFQNEWAMIVAKTSK